MPKKKKKKTSSKVRVPGSKNSIDKMKYEIANEFGVNLGPNASSRENGLVGGEMTKRLIENSMNQSTTTSSSKKRSRKGRSKTKSK